MDSQRFLTRLEWPTIAVLAGCFAVWAFAAIFADDMGWPAYLLIAIACTQYSSLQHEVLHGHPTRNTAVNEALVFLPIGLFIPYPRFRDLHLAHHQNSNLTDPYEDPESWYLCPSTWFGMPGWLRGLYNINNTLAGRMLLGPALSLTRFWSADLRAALAGDGAIIHAWLMHLTGLSLVVAGLTAFSTVSPLAYIGAAYAGVSLLMVRTFLEHRADKSVGARSVIIEDRGPLSLLFLNNNFHAVHHAFPKRAWYQLPGLYRRRRQRFLSGNGGYLFASYWSVFRLYGFRQKEPVKHPLIPVKGVLSADR